MSATTHNRIPTRASPKPSYTIPDFGNLWNPELTYLPNGWAVAIATITPELAMTMLSCNRGDNRNLRERLAVKYGDDIRSRRWYLTHQGIAFDTRGKLCDGQHRLTACVDAEKPFPSLVWFGIGNHEEMSVLDSGASRSLTDASRYMIGETITKYDVATFRAFVDGPVSRQTSYSYSFLISVIEQYGALIPFFRAVGCVGGRDGLPAPCRGAIGRAYYHADRETLIRFSMLACDRIDPSESRDQSAKLLRKYMTSCRSKSSAVKAEMYQKAQRSIFAYLHNESLHRLVAVSDDLFPLPTDEQLDERNQLEDELARRNAIKE